MIDVKDHLTLIRNFQSNNEMLINRTLCLLISSFGNKIKEYGINICRRWPAAKQNAKELTDVAFNEGLFSFFQKVRENGFPDVQVPVERILRSFVIYKLRDLLDSEYRRSIRTTGKDPDEVFASEQYGLLTYQPGHGPAGYKELQARLDKAYSRLKETCRDLIAWRRLLGLKKEDIAARAGLAPSSVNNEVHKCMRSLRDMVKNNNNENCNC